MEFMHGNFVYVQICIKICGIFFPPFSTLLIGRFDVFHMCICACGPRRALFISEICVQNVPGNVNLCSMSFRGDVDHLL